MAMLLRRARFNRCRRFFSSDADPNILSIDRSGLCELPKVYPGPKPDESDMAKHIKGLIMFRGGPIPVAEYMEQILTNPSAGFYSHQEAFGSAGSFVTAPDVSQMFGEMIGVWTMCVWEQLGKPDKLQLVELGPGRGTLMKDLLRSTAKFENFSKAVSVHLVECSPSLRKKQRQALECVAEAQPISLSEDSTQPNIACRSKISNSSVSWYVELAQVPRGVPTIVIAQEFFDALPVHQFQKTQLGWCEKLIDVDDSSGKLRFVLSPEPTIATKLYLPQRLKWATLEEQLSCEHMEVCPGAMRLTQDIAKRIISDSGAAAIIDYGQNKLVSDSLQAIKDHQFVDVLSNPGLADLSAHVDFAAIKMAVADLKSDAATYGPISQSQFLGMLGINHRLEALLKNATEKQAESLQLGYWRLVGEGRPPWLSEEDEGHKMEGMGSQYKVLTIANSKTGPPTCFESA